MSGYFTPASFKFLRALARHNERAWFVAHKADYQRHVRDPFLRLIADLTEPLTRISRHYVADPRPVGGSLFRIHRDTRFARDKRPYKEWAGARFFHRRVREVDGDAPSFYLHLQPGDCFVGGGLWHPQPAALKRVRAYLVNNPASWKQATRSPAFRRAYTLGGTALVRPPQGFAPQHELIADLKRKDFVCTAPLDDAALCRADLLRTIARRFQRVAPLIDWLCGALDLEF
ncbi:MAG: DUF2461 domain-containing protein [Gammaproteobacteria bacterium]|nr:DUF2461 domain-containing protein [Gammaproteobacteria bacterium]